MKHEKQSEQASQRLLQDDGRMGAAPLHLPDLTFLFFSSPSPLASVQHFAYISARLSTPFLASPPLSAFYFIASHCLRPCLKSPSFHPPAPAIPPPPAGEKAQSCRNAGGVTTIISVAVHLLHTCGIIYRRLVPDLPMWALFFSLERRKTRSD